MSGIPLSYQGCDHGGKGSFGQNVVGARLVWYISYSCKSCGAKEEDGESFPPENLRNAVLKKDGYYKLIADCADRLTSIKAIRGVLRYPMETATTLLAHFPVLYVGTETEAKWLKAVVDEAGAASEVVGCDADLNETELAVERLMSEADRQTLW
ncbi:hypothetical protein ABI_29220 [Asticcacaulis biprosthecium C19]|uniref:Uncharacterized protein n=1 Tax=Asticcacaulis biprosthecium C19 TaxID=715226 RepID=F4QMR4_9CAUL|nr:hypothetical protein [Asticcacaulis biprosthecium]EGF91505.1 hypothetical protein ABI_29220 [Asticcacaulis biprosthecium C19]